MTEKYLIMPDTFFVLRAINKGMNNASQIQYNMMITYSHIHHIKKEMKKNNWIVVQKEGRQVTIHLTEKGIEIANAIDNLFKIIGINDKNFMDYRRLSKNKMEVDKMSEEELNEEVPEETTEEAPEEETTEEETTEETTEETSEDAPEEADDLADSTDETDEDSDGDSDEDREGD